MAVVANNASKIKYLRPLPTGIYLAISPGMPALHSPHCLWCGEMIEIRLDASWAYIRAQVSNHVIDCKQRPADASGDDLNRAVHSIMKTAFGDVR
jgi:hypothetical protein